jgi:hypothetical protein
MVGHHGHVSGLSLWQGDGNLSRLTAKSIDSSGKSVLRLNLERNFFPISPKYLIE